MTGSRAGRPPGAVLEAVPAPAEGQPPRTPTPRTSHTTELSTLVIDSTGADGTASAIWLAIASGADVIVAMGWLWTIESTAEMRSPSRPPEGGVPVLEGFSGPAFVEVAEGQLPRTPTPRRSQTKEFTTLVIDCAGADGTATATWLAMAFGADVIVAKGWLWMIESTADIRSPRRPPAVVVVEALCELTLVVVPGEQPPRTPTPRISQTTEFTTLVTVPKGAEGFIDVTWSIIELTTGAAGEAIGS